MPNFVVIAMITYPDDQAAAQDTFNQLAARMTNSSVARIGEAGERTSYCTVGTENPDGTITRTDHAYIDQFGIVRRGEPDPTDPPLWIQPLGAQDAYPLTDVRGDPARVTFDGRVWENTSPANTFQPGVFGWTEIVE
jgi:hypothetical protein